MKKLTLCLAMALGPAASAWSASYPALDTASHWTIQDWGFAPAVGFTFQGVSKKVWTGPEQASQKTVFYNFSLQGIRLNGWEFPLVQANYVGEMDGPNYTAKYGSFMVAPGVNLTASFYFYDNGKFEATTNLSGPLLWAGQPYETVLRFDYDMAGSDNNIAEFLWNANSEGASKSPPQAPAGLAADGRLEFAPAQGTNVNYWSGVNHEVTVSYPALQEAAVAGVERPAFARILNASSPQFGMVLWNGPATPVEAIFQAYAPNTGILDPRPDVSTTMQWMGESGNYPRYPFAGGDQMMHIRLKGAVNGSSLQFAGKLFQRPNNRPLAVDIHQHPPGDLGDWLFNPDFAVKYAGEAVRSFRTALEGLTGAGNLGVRSGAALPYLPYAGYAQPGQSITEAQLHNLMTSTRDYSEAALENVKDWKLDLYLVDWTLEGEGSALSAMFDYGGAGNNPIAREGAAVFWPAIGGPSADYRRKESVLSALHATGLALNMHPAWSNCPFVGYCWQDAGACGGYRCGSACPPGAAGCHYQAYGCRNECVEGTIMSFADHTRNTLQFNGSPAQGSGFSEKDWYRSGPEAWVKPGRFGVAPVASPVLPPFQPY